MKTPALSLFFAFYWCTLFAQDTIPVQKTTNKDSLVYTIVEVMPSFPGGESELIRYLQKNVVYPEKALRKKITGTVFLTFVVDKSGKVDQIKVLRGVSEDLDEESVRVVRSMPSWKPGTQDGEPVNVQFYLPIRFSLK